MGKKSPAPPPAPDYAGAAQQQGIANLEAARLTARLSNPNVITPLGTQTVSWGRPQFNKQAYDAAMAQWRARNPQAPGATPTPGAPPAPGAAPSPAGPIMGGAPPAAPITSPPTYGIEPERGYLPPSDLMEERVEPLGGGAARFREDTTMPRGSLGGGPGLGRVTLPNGTTVPASYFVGGAPSTTDYTSDLMPTPEMFTQTVDLDTPTIIQELTPEAKATLEAQQRVERALSGLGETAIKKVGKIYGDTFTPTGLPEQRFGFEYGQLPTLPDLGGMGQFQRGVTPEAMAGVPDITAMGRAGGGPAAPGQIVGADLAGVGGVQRGVDVGGLAQLPVGAGATGQEAIMSRLQPQLQRERAQLETQLRNQGLVPGGEAYNAEVQLFNQRANDAMQQAALQGINLDAQMRAQGFSERQIQAQLANQAQQQAFQQQLASGAFGREGQQLAFQMGQSAQQAQNQALAQNQAAAMQAYQAQLARQAQGFGQQMDVAGLYNAALAAQQQSALQQAQAAAALQAQGYNQAQGAAAFQNAQRQAALQEQLALRSQPLNEIAAIMGGAQVQMPQFQAYQGADVAAAPIFGATQAAGQFAQQNYANQVAARNAQLGLYGDLFGTIGGLAGGKGIKGLIG